MAIIRGWVLTNVFFLLFFGMGTAFFLLLIGWSFDQTEHMTMTTRVCMFAIGAQHFVALVIWLVMERIDHNWLNGPMKISQEQIRALAKGMSSMTDEEREELRKTMEGR
jgi:hypothetical protein